MSGVHPTRPGLKLLLCSPITELGVQMDCFAVQKNPASLVSTLSDTASFYHGTSNACFDFAITPAGAPGFFLLPRTDVCIDGPQPTKRLATTGLK